MPSSTPRPVISEKAFAIAEKGTYLFEVPLKLNKVEIQQAIEQRFAVKVADVRTTILKGKETRRRTRKTNVPGRRSDRKRAYVTLKAGEKIAIFEDAK